jgi:hypothetical protein
MRLGIRAKQIAGVTAIVGLTVVLLSSLAAAMVSSLVMNESLSRGKLIALMIYERAREVVPTSSDPYAGLRDDEGLRSILRGSVYGESVTGASVIDRTGIVVASRRATTSNRSWKPVPSGSCR